MRREAFLVSYSVTALGAVLGGRFRQEAGKGRIHEVGEGCLHFLLIGLRMML